MLNSRYEQLSGKPLDFKTASAVIRINTLKITPEKLIKKLNAKNVKLEKISYLDFGYKVKVAPFSMGSTPEYLQGYYYLQGAASQLPVQYLDVKPTDVVLDMAASPGSKTTQLVQYMKNKSTLVAIEFKQNRLSSLKNNLQRCGVQNTIIYKKDSRNLDLPIKFDKILLDAPCSGNYTQSTNWIRKRTMRGIQTNAELQKQLLASAFKSCKPGGEIVYSTCSLEPEEDEMNVVWFLKNFKVKLIPLKHKLSTHLKEYKKQKFPSGCIRLWPHKSGTQGFFIAKFKKNI